MNQLNAIGYKPLPPQVTIKESSIDGLGLFAVEQIEEESIIGLTHKRMGILELRWEDL